MERKISIFFYGTLSNEKVFRTLTGFKVRGVSAWIRHHACVPLKYVVYPGLVPSRGIQTPGVLYELPSSVLAYMDCFEDSFYKRVKRRVFKENQTLSWAWIYLLKEPHRRKECPELWSKEHFERTQLTSYLLMCQQFRKKYSQKFFPPHRKNPFFPRKK